MVLLSIALVFAGLIVGLGAVTVIDLHGFLARKSAYWTEATTRTHHVTKPLIWLGTILYAAGLALGCYGGVLDVGALQWITLAALVCNGIFLSFVVSPFLIARERSGRAAELLPEKWQASVAVSFVVSFTCWWGSVALLLVDLAEKLQ